MNIDKIEVTRALHAFFQPGDVFEIRVLEASTADFRRPHIESGYFDYEHIELVSESLRHIQSYRGVIFNLIEAFMSPLIRLILICFRELFIVCDTQGETQQPLMQISLVVDGC